MSASPIAMLDALSHAGRSDYQGRFHRTDYAHSNTKHEQREKVLGFILGKHPADTALRLLSLPGADWTFERMAQLAHGAHCQFVGLERSFTVFHQSRRAIPGPVGEDSAQVEERMMAFGSGNIYYARRSALGPRVGKFYTDASGRVHESKGRRQDRSHRLLLMDVATFTSVLSTRYGESPIQRREFSERFCRRSAAWLDFTAPICSSVLTAVANLQNVVSAASAPVVVTVMNCRDRFSGTEARVRALADAQPAFKVATHWTYIGAGGVSMLTACGVLLNKAQERLGEDCFGGAA